MKGGHNKFEVVKSDVAKPLFLNSFCFSKLQNTTKVYINGFSKISMATIHYHLNTNHILKLR